MPPLRTNHYLSPGGWGCQKILGRITQFSMVTERGSEYNIVEREDSGKLTASGEGGGENQINFIGYNQSCSTPLPFLANEECTFYQLMTFWSPQHVCITCLSLIFMTSIHPPPTPFPNSSQFMEQYTDRSSLPNFRVQALLGLPLRREHQCVMSVDSCVVVIWNITQHMVSCEIGFFQLSIHCIGIASLWFISGPANSHQSLTLLDAIVNPKVTTL